MRLQHSQHRSKMRKLACLFLLALILAAATPVLAAYLGPDRTRTVQQTSCEVILRECQYIASKGDYRYHQVENWSCSSESKPWLSYSSQASGCDSSSVGDTYWEKKETVEDITQTFPEATISGVLQNCSVRNGWCTTASQLSLSGIEPVPGYNILGLEGTRNGQTFACTGPTCSVPLVEGNNNFTYWALSSWADTSLMGSLSARVDTVKPAISGTLTAAPGTNGWFTSPVVFNGSASDSTSGLAAFTCTLDGVALASCSTVTVNSQGPHSLVFTARDNAGQTNSLTQNASIDSQAPALNVSLVGSSGPDPAWYTSARLNGSASDVSPGSGLSAFEYRLDQGGWAAFPASGELALPDGSHTVEVRATDKAGLTAASLKAFSLDSIPPTIAIDPAGTLGANNWYITGLKVNASATDETSGMGGLEYSLDNDAWLPYTAALDLTDGIHEISFWAADQAGLASQVEQTYQIDTHPPAIEGSLSGVSGENGWFTSNVTLSASALDPQPGSGLGTFSYILDGAPEDPYTVPIVLTDGRHSLRLHARDQAGLSYTMEQAVNVDTLPPAVTVKTVPPSWVREIVTLEGTSQDAGSGLAALEISTNGGQSWQPVTDATAWNYSWDTSKSPNGSNELKVRAIDKAGLVTQQTITTGVDNSAPTITLPDSWFQWNKITLDIHDEHSGLSEARLEISDPRGRGPARIIALDTATFPMQFKWDRRFADGTTAPEGRYDVKVIAADKLGNSAIGNATVKVLLDLPPGPTATALPPPRPSATPTVSSISTPTLRPLSTATQAVVVRGFGSTLEPRATATPKPGMTSTPRVVPTQNKVVEWFDSILPSHLDTGARTTEISSLGVASTAAPSGSNVLWGAAAAAALGSLAAYALEEKRKPGEERARPAAREANDEERRAKMQAKHMAKMEARRAQERAWEDARKREEQKEDLYQAHMDARMLAREIADEARWTAAKKAEIEEKKRVEEKEQAREQQGAMAAYYAAMLQTAKKAPQQEPNWWEKTKTFVSTNISEPINTDLYEPYIKPAVEVRNQVQHSIQGWLDENAYQPFIKPAIESTKQFIHDASAWAHEKIYLDHIVPAMESTRQFLVNEGNWINQQIYQPYIKPVVETTKQNFIEEASFINEKIYQPYIRPMVEIAKQKLVDETALINEKIYQPYIKPLVDKTEEFLISQSSLINEKIIQPIKSVVDQGMDDLTAGVSWINQNIYQPIFEPVVNDINKYIYKPLEDKTEAWWGQYGEWVHGALDAAGFVPGIGEIADGLNGLVYLGEGRYIEASVSALAMIPIVGDLGKAGKWGLKLGAELLEEATEKAAKEIIQETVEEGLEIASEKVAKETAEKLISKHGNHAVKLLDVINPKSAKKLLDTVDKDVLDYVMEQGPDAVEAFSKWNGKDLRQHGAELALRAKKDAKALDYVKKLLDTKPIDPKNLTTRQKRLIQAIAGNSTQYPDGGQIVLGKWVDQGSGFVEAARNTGSLHYNPHPDMWNMFGELGERRDEVAWLVNQRIVQTGVGKGLPFEYTFNGIPKHILKNEQTAIRAIFSGKTDKEILDLLKVKNIPVRLQEIQELHKAGFELTFDGLTNSYIFIRP